MTEISHKKSGKYASGFGLSFVMASLFNALVVVLKDTDEALKACMKTFIGHHWVTHGLLVLTLFIVLGLVLSNIKAEEKLALDAKKMPIAITAATLIGGIIIVGFYLTRL